MKNNGSRPSLISFLAVYLRIYSQHNLFLKQPIYVKKDCPSHYLKQVICFGKNATGFTVSMQGGMICIEKNNSHTQSPLVRLHWNHPAVCSPQMVKQTSPTSILNVAFCSIPLVYLHVGRWHTKWRSRGNTVEFLWNSYCVVVVRKYDASVLLNNTRYLD